MQRVRRRLEREWKTIAAMIALFCGDLHQKTTVGAHGRAPLQSGSSLCAECRDLAAYARRRLEKCPFKEDKPTCAKCPVHCYKPAARERIRTVMKYTGPRLLFRRPILAIRHMLAERREPPSSIPRRGAA